MEVEEKMIKIGFAFYPSDLKAMDDHLAVLEKARVPTRRAALVRALVCMPTQGQLFAHALLMHEAQKARGGLLETETVAEIIDVRLPESQIDKLEEVLRDLTAKGATGISVRLAFIVRAAFRALPTGPALVSFMKDFNERFPKRPRGLPAAMRKKAKKHG